MVVNEPDSMRAVMAAPAISAQSQTGPRCRRFIPAPMASRSAVMLRVLATMRPTTRAPTTMRPLVSNRRRHRVPRLLPVARAVRSQISCTVAISGNVTRAVHNSPRPNWAPA